MSKLAFFDLDKTLLSYNSANAWLRREFKQGHINTISALKAGFWLLQYHLGMSSMEEPIRKAGRFVTGTLELDMIERVAEFWEQEVRHNIRHRANEVLEKHRKSGDHIALLTSSSNYLGGFAAEHWNIPHTHTTV